MHQRGLCELLGDGAQRPSLVAEPFHGRDRLLMLRHWQQAAVIAEADSHLQLSHVTVIGPDHS